MPFTAHVNDNARSGKLTKRAAIGRCLALSDRTLSERPPRDFYAAKQIVRCCIEGGEDGTLHLAWALAHAFKCSVSRYVVKNKTLIRLTPAPPPRPVSSLPP